MAKTDAAGLPGHTVFEDANGKKISFNKSAITAVHETGNDVTLITLPGHSVKVALPFAKVIAALIKGDKDAD